jgi:mRNA deadenylase 3'-5' endonuclease subunit Ccr4
MAFAFTLGTWNILASAYIRRSFYPNTPQSMLEARSRVPALVRRAIELQLDILCLQEVEPAVFAPLQEGLVANGYQGTMALKGGGKPDGCAIFFRTSCFNLLNEWRVEYQDGASRGPNSGHIAQRMTLDIGGVRLALVNTHLKWDPPETPTEQQWGYRQASEALRLVTEEAADVQAICGDFNATPDADAVELLIESGFDYTHRNCAQTFTCNSNRMPKLIDYIAFRGSVRAEPLQVPAIDGHTPLPSEEQPSDHLPLTAKLILAL